MIAKLCCCSEFPYENPTCPVHNPKVTYDEVLVYAKKLSIDIASLVLHVYNRELVSGHIFDACYAIEIYYPNSDAPDWLQALAAGNPEEITELADEVRRMLLLEIAGVNDD